MTNGRENIEHGRLLFRQLFDASPAHVALLDLDGLILETNSAWNRFSLDHGVPASYTFEGKNYLDACQASSMEDSLIARQAYTGLRGVLLMQRPKFTMVYPCHTPVKKLWYRMWVEAQVPQVPAVVVAHYMLEATKAGNTHKYTQNWTNAHAVAETMH